MAKFIENTQFDNYKILMTDTNSFTIGLTGLTVSVEISNDAGFFSSSIGSVSELQSGWYVLNTVNSSEVIAGSFIIQAMASGANDWRDVIYPEELSLAANLPTNFSDLFVSSGTGRVSVASLYVPADMTTTAMSSLNSLIFTDPLSKYEGTTDRNLARGLAFLANRVDFSGDTMQVKKSDDSTNFWTASTSGDSTADPIVAKDPSS